MTVPYRDINVHAAADSYTFTSPSSPNAPALAIDRPTGDVRLTEGPALTSKRVQRVSSIAGILGIISLRLGTGLPSLPPNLNPLTRGAVVWQTNMSSSSPRPSP